MTDEAVIVLFQEREAPSEIHRTSLLKIEYKNGRQVIFNEFGQIAAEVTLPQPAVVADVLNPSIVKLEIGEEVVLNGVDFSLPTDSLELRHFQEDTEYVRKLIKSRTAQLQYVILPSGSIFNTEIIKRGYCRVDRGKTADLS